MHGAHRGDAATVTDIAIRAMPRSAVTAASCHASAMPHAPAPAPPGSRRSASWSLVLAAAVLLGWLLGHVWPVLTVAALGVVAWHYWHLRKRAAAADRAAARRSRRSGDGVWNELDRLLYRSQAEMRSRKRRLLDMLRAYRAAAAALPDAVVVVERNSQRVQLVQRGRDRAARPAAIPTTSTRRSASACNRCRCRTGWRPGRNAEPMLDAASPVDPDTAPQPAPDPVFGRTTGCWSRATSAR